MLFNGNEYFNLTVPDQRFITLLFLPVQSNVYVYVQIKLYKRTRSNYETKYKSD